MTLDKRPIGQKLITNTKYNFFFILLVFTAGFLVIPLQIKHLGFKHYSLLVLINLVFSYLQLFDFGLQTTVKKHLAETCIPQKKQSFSQYLSNALIISLSLTLFALFSIFLLSQITKTLGFKIESQLVNHFVQLLSLSFLFIPFYGLLKFCEFSLKALQRDDLVFKANLPIFLAYMLGSFLLLSKTKNLIYFFVFQKTIFLIGLIIEFFLLKNIVQLKLSFRLLNKKVIKKILKFAINIQLVKIGNFINEQTDKLFISYLLQSTLLGFYQIGFQIISTVRNLPIVLISTLVPAVSELSSLGEKEKILRLYIFLSKCMIFAVFPLLFFTAVFADKIILLWLQENLPLSYKIIWILAPCFLVNGLTFVGTNLATGIGVPQFQAKAAIFQMIANLGLTYIFVLKFGYLGAALATTITLTTTSLYFLQKLHQKLKLSNLIFLKTTAISPLIFSILSSLLASLSRLFVKTGNRVETFVFLTIGSLLFFPIYLLLIRFSGFFKAEDKQKFLFIRKNLLSKKI